VCKFKGWIGRVKERKRKGGGEEGKGGGGGGGGGAKINESLTSDACLRAEGKYEYIYRFV